MVQIQKVLPLLYLLLFLGHEWKYQNINQIMPKQKGGIQSKSWTFQYGVSMSVLKKKQNEMIIRYLNTLKRIIAQTHQQP